MLLHSAMYPPMMLGSITDLMLNFLPAGILSAVCAHKQTFQQVQQAIATKSNGKYQHMLALPSYQVAF